MRINGLEAATGAIKVQGTNGPIELRLAAIRTEPAHIYRFRFVTPLSLLAQLGPANLRTFQSFRTLTSAQAAALKPLRVRVVSVKKGDTVAKLAKRMAFDSYAAERFRVLNGLPPGVEFVSRPRVKIITE
jgi:predicted Zn-dependent protease